MRLDQLGEESFMVWYLQLTASLAAAGFIYEVSLALIIYFVGLQDKFNQDLSWRRRLRLNRKMIFVFTFLSTIYHLMSFNFQYVQRAGLQNITEGIKLSTAFATLNGLFAPPWCYQSMASCHILRKASLRMPLFPRRFSQVSTASFLGRAW